MHNYVTWKVPFRPVCWLWCCYYHGCYNAYKVRNVNGRIKFSSKHSHYKGFCKLFNFLFHFNCIKWYVHNIFFFGCSSISNNLENLMCLLCTLKCWRKGTWPEEKHEKKCNLWKIFILVFTNQIYVYLWKTGPINTKILNYLKF